MFLNLYEPTNKSEEVSNTHLCRFWHLNDVYCFFFFWQMEGIPNKSRNLAMHLMTGKLYRNTRHTRAAVACYKECLRFVLLWTK